MQQPINPTIRDAWWSELRDALCAGFEDAFARGSIVHGLAQLRESDRVTHHQSPALTNPAEDPTAADAYWHRMVQVILSGIPKPDPGFVARLEANIAAFRAR